MASSVTTRGTRRLARNGHDDPISGTYRANSGEPTRCTPAVDGSGSRVLGERELRHRERRGEETGVPEGEPCPYCAYLAPNPDEFRQHLIHLHPEVEPEPDWWDRDAVPPPT